MPKGRPRLHPAPSTSPYPAAAAAASSSSAGSGGRTPAASTSSGGISAAYVEMLCVYIRGNMSQGVVCRVSLGSPKGFIHTGWRIRRESVAKWSRSGVFMRTEVLVISYPILQCAMSYFILPSLCCPPSHLCCLRSEPNSDVSLQPEPFDEPDQ